MDSWQKSLGRIAAQLRGMTVSQKLALVLGAVLVAGSLGGMIFWAGRSEMVPLLDLDLSPTEIATVRSGLDALGEKSETRGNKVYVSASANRQALLAQLQQQERLPADTSRGFDALVKESNPWVSEAENDRRWTVALKYEIERVLRQFNGVASAEVLLNMGSARRSFSRQEAPSSASVTLIMKGGEPVPRSLALAAARLVSGAVRGLPLKNVQVVDGGTGASALEWDQESETATVLNRERQRQERLHEDKIRGQLAFDPRARVNVRIELDTTSKTMQSSTPTEAIDTSVETTSETTTRVRRGGQGGVEPNVGITANAGGADESHSKDTSRVHSEPGFMAKTETAPGGDIKEIFAAINISYSYLASVFARINGEDAKPTPEQIEALFQKERERIESQVLKLVKPQDAEHIAVSWYYDAVLPDVPAGGATQDAMGGVMDLAQRYGASAGLAMLALLSLGLMWRLSRRSESGDALGLELGLPKEAIEAARRAADDVAAAAARRGQVASARAADAAIPRVGSEPSLEPTQVMPVGQAAVTEGVLVAREVDEGAVQTRKMLDQVAQLVDRDAEGMATLLEQWIRRQNAMS